MKKLLLFFPAGLFAIAAEAQTSCNASMTWVQNPNSYSVTFTNTSTVAPAMPSSPFANTNRYVVLLPSGQFYNSNNTYTHNFGAAGTYTVAAGVNYMDSAGSVGLWCQDTTWYTVTLASQPCVVSITNVWGGGNSRGFTVNNGSATTGATYTWNYGDGSATTTGVNGTHTYTTPGTYTVTVTVTGNGCSNTAQVSVTINPPINCANTNAAFTASTPNASGNVTCTNTSTPTIASTANVGTRSNTWSWGDGTTSTYSSNQLGASHTYAATGTYTIRLTTQLFDSSINQYTCNDTAYQTVTVSSTTGTNLNCATTSNNFTVVGSGITRTFTPSITPLNTPGVTIANTWTWGDGTTTNTASTGGQAHTYQQPGTYNVCLNTRWLQSGTVAPICTLTTCQTIIVTQTNAIYGWVSTDSTTAMTNDTFKVWLIEFNSNTSTLSAVDSTVVPGTWSAGFQFNNKPAGIYRTKAHKLNQLPGINGYVPTYRDSSLHWGNALTFNHNSGQTYTGAIYLRHGLVTSGPGFVGGSILSGANKGTADGDPVANQLVFIRDAATDKLVQAVYTNAAGVYSFSNLPIGAYEIYPEEMNYVTTPSAAISITASAPSVTGILFKKDDVDRDIKQVTTGIDAVTGGVAFSMVPNPASSRVQLTLADGGAADVRIFSVSGQKVYEQRVAAGKNAALEVGNLPAGVYSVHVAGAAGVGTAELVIAR